MSNLARRAVLGRGWDWVSKVPSEERFEAVRQELVDRTLARGRGLGRSFCSFERPQNEYFVSTLAAREESEEGEDEGEFSESRPSLISLKVRPASSTEPLEIRLSCNVYIPSFPTRKEYEIVRDEVTTSTSREFTTDTAFFRRVDVEYTDTIEPGDGIETEAARVADGLRETIRAEVKEACRSHLLVRDAESVVGAEVDLEDEAEFETVREELAAHDDQPPRWNVEFEIEVRDGEWVLSLINDSIEDESRETDRFIFNPKISVEGNFERYTLNLIPRDYRYDRKIWGKGQNCSIDSASLEDGSRLIETTAIPEYQSHRFSQNDEYDTHTDPSMLADVDGIIPALEAIESGMEDYHARWTGPLRREKRQELTSDELEEFDDAADRFAEEIANFRHGIEVLQEVEDARRAFAMMNESFADRIPNWHLFQLVFIVSNLGSIVSREHPGIATKKDEKAEVLWFPTGGGKTEAYLGLIVFGLLFDRLRGKHRGVTAWIRFPLRLLGKQQKDRFLEALHAANQVREDRIEDPGEAFSIGYFVGGYDTPNSIAQGQDGRNNYNRTFQEDDETLREKCLVVDECPGCGGEVDVEFDAERNAIYHHCVEEDCQVARLPLYVTDHDIYREIPSVLLGTLDKISILGSNPRFTNLLGNLTSRCPVHGYGYAGKCPEKSTLDCEEDLEAVPDGEVPYDPIPSLHLIDEVHLLNEELGVFAGQYETLYRTLCKKLSQDGHEPKVVTSTATISKYEDQMWNLFLKEAERFPEEGPTLDESFYGSVDYDSRERRYIGLTPVNKTHIYAVLDLVKKYHQTIRDLRDEDPGRFGVDEGEYEQILDMYELSVVYFLKKTEKDRFLRSIQNQINREMERDGYEVDLLTEQLTADIDSTTILDELANPDGPFDERTDIIGATSFIGHGIDVDRFNTMFFFGFPSETFQYIQSSARVGRKHPGTVIDIFRPYDERDKHRYKYFTKSHEYLRRAVEAVSIDRWSKFSLEKTYGGIFKAILMQYYRPLMHEKYDVNVQSSRELSNVIDDPDQYPEFSREQYQELLFRAYGLDRTDDEYFEQQISKLTEEYWEYWVKKLKAENFTTIKGEAMRNLRDIGDQAEIGIDQDERSFYEALTGGSS